LPVLLARVDDRLIHGQVTLGWGSLLTPEAYVVVDSDAASSPEARALLESSASPSDVYVVDAIEVAGLITSAALSHKRVMLIAKTPGHFLKILDCGAEFSELNLGGMHWSEGKTKYLDYLYMDECDVDKLMQLAARGIAVYAKDVPGGPRIDLDELLRRKGE
jgi:mannose/fructose/N-acetylgalactosamine-specific phosphotransferase system component IIB